MSVTRVLRMQLPALLLVAFWVAGCGSGEPNADDTVAGDDSTASTTGKPTSSAPAGTPECASVWQGGGTLPRAYAGCVDETGQLVDKDALGCSSGQRIIRYDDRYYGVPGGTVHAASPSLEQDPEYLAAVRRCRA